MARGCGRAAGCEAPGGAAPGVKGTDPSPRPHPSSTRTKPPAVGLCGLGQLLRLPVPRAPLGGASCGPPKATVGSRPPGPAALRLQGLCRWSWDGATLGWVAPKGDAGCPEEAWGHAGRRTGRSAVGGATRPQSSPVIRGGPAAAESTEACAHGVQ